ncbi:AraC family transcriptional regulator [Cellulomonas sp. zg-ZUI22]|uniref:GyrI-like domain-containing protein n=1 Tax=Cellulomonas sp. zg-ZUI22 TaxID=2816955 RepID=UPI001A949595|nr:GyrI-like domain-containing protein [Cellulomonas sp. zg-ZUI22]MBO0898748.1 AraC family transcriptional regulator [Cellulomonas sp. zg-ZUI22]
MSTTPTDRPTVRIAAVRATVPAAELVAFFDRTYTAVADTVRREGWTFSGPALARYHGMPTDSVDVTGGFPVEGAPLGPVSDGVEVMELPGGAALEATHTGSYDRLPDAWDRLEQERAALGVDGRGDFWEEYVTEPSPGGDPDANVTRLVLPLRAEG